MDDKRPAASVDIRFTAVLTLVGSIVGYIAGIIPHWFDFDLTERASREHQVELFSQTLKTDAAEFSTANDQAKIAFLGAIYSLATSMDDAGQRRQEKRAVISLVYQLPQAVQRGMGFIYADDPEAAPILAEMPNAALALAESQPTPSTNSKNADTALDQHAVPSLDVSPNPGAATWVYLGKSDDGKTLLDDYTAAHAVPSPGSTVEITAFVNLRDSPPISQGHLGNIIGLAKPESNFYVCGPVKTAHLGNATGDAVWAPVAPDAKSCPSP